MVICSSRAFPNCPLSSLILLSLSTTKLLLCCPSASFFGVSSYTVNPCFTRGMAQLKQYCSTSPPDSSLATRYLAAFPSPFTHSLLDTLTPSRSLLTDTRFPKLPNTIDPSRSFPV